LPAGTCLQKYDPRCRGSSEKAFLSSSGGDSARSGARPGEARKTAAGKCHGRRVWFFSLDDERVAESLVSSRRESDQLLPQSAEIRCLPRGLDSVRRCWPERSSG